jgi:hypothetical protein
MRALAVRDGDVADAAGRADEWRVPEEAAHVQLGLRHVAGRVPVRPVDAHQRDDQRCRQRDQRGQREPVDQAVAVAADGDHRAVGGIGHEFGLAFVVRPGVGVHRARH